MSLILVGQYDSPFVRRVAVALREYGMPYEHRPWSVWRNADQIAELNPLRRVPVLVLDDGSALVETFAILDHLDELAGPERTLLSRSGPVRTEALRICSLFAGLADKAISLLYETLFRSSPSDVWMDRCRRQITDTLAVLEAARAAIPSPFWLGNALGHVDIALACTLRFTAEAHPSSFDPARYPALAAAAARCEALAVFAGVVQPTVNVT